MKTEFQIRHFRKVISIGRLKPIKYRLAGYIFKEDFYVKNLTNNSKQRFCFRIRNLKKGVYKLETQFENKPVKIVYYHIGQRFYTSIDECDFQVVFHTYQRFSVFQNIPQRNEWVQVGFCEKRNLGLITSKYDLTHNSEIRIKHLQQIIVYFFGIVLHLNINKLSTSIFGSESLIEYKPQDTDWQPS